MKMMPRCQGFPVLESNGGAVERQFQDVHCLRQRKEAGSFGGYNVAVYILVLLKGNDTPLSCQQQLASFPGSSPAFCCILY